MATVTSNVPEKPVDSPVIAPQNTSSKVAYIALLILSAGICAAGAYGLVNKAGFIAKQLSYTGSLVAASAGGATMLISIALLATSKAAPVAAKESEETTEDDALQFGDAHGWTYSDDGKLEPNQYTFDSKKIAANVDGRVCTFDLVNEHTPFGVKLVVSENGICTNLPQPVQIFEKSDKGHFVPTQNGFNETNTFLQDTYNPFITEAWKSQDGQLTDGSFQFPVAEDGSVTVNGSVVMNSKGEIDIGALGNAINTHLLPIQLEGNIDTPEAALQLFKAENPEDMRYSTAYSQAQQCTFLVIRLHGMYYVKKLIGNYEPLKATRIAQDTPDLIEQADAADKPKGANSTRSAVGSVRSKTTANPKSAASSQVTTATITNKSAVVRDCSFQRQDNVDGKIGELTYRVGDGEEEPLCVDVYEHGRPGCLSIKEEGTVYYTHENFMGSACFAKVDSTNVVITHPQIHSLIAASKQKLENHFPFRLQEINAASTKGQLPTDLIEGETRYTHLKVGDQEYLIHSYKEAGKPIEHSFVQKGGQLEFNQKDAATDINVCGTTIGYYIDGQLCPKLDALAKRPEGATKITGGNATASTYASQQMAEMWADTNNAWIFESGTHLFYFINIATNGKAKIPWMNDTRTARSMWRSKADENAGKPLLYTPKDGGDDITVKEENYQEIVNDFNHRLESAV